MGIGTPTSSTFLPSLEEKLINKILSLKDDGGNIISDPTEINDHIVNHYETLFRSEQNNNLPDIISNESINCSDFPSLLESINCSDFYMMTNIYYDTLY